MTPTQARAFFAVAKAGSFTGAGRLLNVSQPTLTTQVRELEQTYGIELFVRNAAGVQLTDVGTELFPLVEIWQSAQRECNEYLSGLRAFEGAKLTIGTYGPYDAIHLAAMIRERYNAIELSILFGNSHQLMGMLRSHDIDVAVMSGASGKAEFRCLSYHRRRLVALVPRGHEWWGLHSISLETLTKGPLLFRENGSVVQESLESAARAEGVRLGSITKIGSREGIVAAVEHGLGIGVIYEEGSIPKDKMRVVPIAGIRGTASVDVVCLTERSDNLIIKRFMDLAGLDCDPAESEPTAA